MINLDTVFLRNCYMMRIIYSLIFDQFQFETQIVNLVSFAFDQAMIDWDSQPHHVVFDLFYIGIDFKWEHHIVKIYTKN